ncbi:LysR substrate-binding domain-containing protein [Marinobacter sp. M3C]|uniref:LysR substrate-binding domain-containing protein n=1 Tax=unclassified Marinobacter TaxID=83889 RepID=UPI00200D0FF0|nr:MULTISPECIES: LysR substrate-binding domain-containing protein [unclassified Marinobacter]MCL1476220.1 LysR substrate-binding domain-containing protein [Marinobacter sp.]MCL1482974.1 LysR substrate-binding domain-containing protein [Marinobacter sp.]MCL1488789.1 LysR substrate-binding domain-containing protein [Marinobacter sp.]UQG58129.1 LysR substrate-binding domain-containing protein [Marinobacter sp. M4C]UQG60573.1 LysR substrate-binding domain-containing protein [Marinobacter sp. M3C]
MNQIDLVTLKLFIAIHEEGKLSAVAEREHIALAAVSKRISDLEARIGSKLLYRRSRGVELTPAGHALLHHAFNILDAIKRLHADLSEYGEGIKGHVRIHANTSAVIAFLPQDLSVFAKIYPQIKIDLQERISTEVIDAVRNGLTDIGIFASHVDPDGLEIMPYRSDRLVLVVPDDHSLAQRSSISFKEAADQDFVGLQTDTSLQILLQEQTALAGKDLRMRIQVRSFDAICRMVHYGMGIGILPLMTIHTELSELGLKSIPLEDSWAARKLVIGIQSYDKLPLPAKQLVSQLSKKL